MSGAAWRRTFSSLIWLYVDQQTPLQCSGNLLPRTSGDVFPWLFDDPPSISFSDTADAEVSWLFYAVRSVEACEASSHLRRLIRWSLASSRGSVLCRSARLSP